MTCKKGEANRLYGPELGVHFGWLDKDGRKAKGTRTWGGIKNVKRPQLAINSFWSARVQESIEKAKRQYLTYSFLRI